MAIISKLCCHFRLQQLWVLNLDFGVHVLVRALEHDMMGRQHDPIEVTLILSFLNEDSLPCTVTPTDARLFIQDIQDAGSHSRNQQTATRIRSF